VRLRKFPQSDFSRLELSYCYGILLSTYLQLRKSVKENHIAIYQDVDVINVAIQKKKLSYRQNMKITYLKITIQQRQSELVA
jgi:hypothetical protein